MEALEGLNKTAHEKFDAVSDMNDKKIQLKCGEVQRQLEVSPHHSRAGATGPVGPVLTGPLFRSCIRLLSVV